ncbi:hypothetical protein MKY34_11030 [Sporosarcina sp. FSL K6-1522]|uniref:hypothetical protein n=1 Tax=Sporosarcina sp. FSL K6-1522 TaxID=2921554 RepID=UPI003159A53A
MFRAWKFIFLLTVSLLLLAGCGKTLEERAVAGVEAAKVAFESDEKEQTDEIDGVNLYKPAGFTINDKSDSQNILLTKGKETFILFINPNEHSGSPLFHELLVGDSSKEIIEKATFETDDGFGFAAVVKGEEDRVELVASVGGVKMTAMSKDKKIEENLATMMEIVRSIEQDTEINGGN